MNEIMKSLDKVMSGEVLPYLWDCFPQDRKAWVLRQIQEEGKDLDKLPEYMKKDLELIRPAIWAGQGAWLSGQWMRR